LWVVAGSRLLRVGPAGWLAQPRLARNLGGVLLLLAAWLAIVQARRIGLNFLFSAMSLVWVADISAYFAGRHLGGRWFVAKLAPSISPGKTWEGVLGGVCGVLLTGAVWLICESYGGGDSPSIYRYLLNFGLPVAFLGCLFLTAMSVVGDLIESLVKRAAGFKDSSQLLPGHGGVLDRVDALLPTLPLAMMFATLGVP
jgi:phosphatidate cytidylyltransferase